MVFVACALAIVACPLVYVVETTTVTGMSAASLAAEQKGLSLAVSPATEFFPQPTASEKKILEVLEKPTDAEFNETPLRDVIDFLQDFHNYQIQIQLDKKAIKDQGLDSDTQVTGKLKGLPFRSVLRLLFSEYGLSFIIRNDVLVITTR